MSKKLRVTLVRSAIGYKQDQKDTVRSSDTEQSLLPHGHNELILGLLPIIVMGEHLPKADVKRERGTKA